MRLLIAPLAALSLLAGLGPALARCPLYLPMRVGPTTGNPEKDTVGLFCAQPDTALPPAGQASRYSVVPVGATIGDVEKDSVGFALSPVAAQAAR
ncbi:hypothetical protein [Methylobacterium sp. SyP6R]|uniref:hypothetical protein n=1 Tax=Methylobacterium sp. SyP6R TaxID=2718876 RepID=UPI001F1896C9|nr:hypothetical protein [Methylobacterium sp. SyP6R]MCF4128979.1 hypothetical protein [Methylobacterium sp. SyP6R]